MENWLYLAPNVFVDQMIFALIIEDDVNLFSARATNIRTLNRTYL